jgi:hypothetical protein
MNFGTRPPSTNKQDMMLEQNSMFIGIYKKLEDVIEDNMRHVSL